MRVAVFRMILLAGVFVSGVVHGQTPREALEEMNERVAGLETYRVKLTGVQTLRGPRERQMTRTEGEIAARGDLRRIEITVIDDEGNRVRNLKVFDGRTYWEYDEGQGLARKVEIGELGEAARERLAAEMDPANLGFFGDLEYELDEVTEGGKRYRVLRTTGPSELMGQKLDLVEIRIDPATGLPARLEMNMTVEVRGEGDRSLAFSQGSVQEFSGWEPGADIPAGRFVFTPPEGVRVFDATALTEMLLTAGPAAEARRPDEAEAEELER